jgi:hypothetical protein
MNATAVNDLKGARATAAKGPVAPNDSASAPSRLRQALAGIPVSPWKWLAVTCAMLGISGGTRYWSDLQATARTEESRQCPFPLNEIPKVVGEWVFNGTEGQLDPEIARIAGSSDHIIRNYTRTISGETVSVLVLYGLATSVFAHTAEACYPAAGFTRIGKTSDYKLTIPGAGKTAGYRVGLYSKKIAPGLSQYAEVFYAFRHDGVWVPDAADRWKKFRSHPGMFKIQIERHVNEISPETSPSIALLGDLMQEIENRLAAPPGTPAK